MKKIVFAASLLLAGLFIFSCAKKEATDNTPTGPAELSVQIKNAEGLYEIPKSQSRTLELSVKANPTSAEAYTSITLAVNSDLVAAYNSKNGTEYELAPATSYVLAATSLQLPRYNAESNTCEIRLKTDGLELNKVYLLPVAIEEVVGGTNFSAPDEKAAYILVKMVPAKAQGAGTESDPYLIGSVDEFLLIANLLQDNATTYFKLGADIDFAETVTEDNAWEPIVTNADRKIFLDGNNHKISNIKNADAGLFKQLVGTVQNLNIEGVEIIEDQTDDLGILANIAGSFKEKVQDTDPDEVNGTATIKNVNVTLSKINDDADHIGGDYNRRRGGLVGRLIDGSVLNCTSSCEVFAGNRSGGLIGYADNGTISDCSASGNVTVAKYMGGGLIGVACNVTITNCHASGNLVSKGGNYVRNGGLVGQIEGNATIEKCYATGAISGQGHMGGGLVGVVGKGGVTVSIDQCYATGSVTLPTGGNWAHAGAFLGTVNAEGAKVNISNCYSTGAVTVRRYSSGFVGSIYSLAATLTISNSYTTSDISGIALQTHCGLLIGNIDNADAVVNCTGFIAWNTCNGAFCYPDGRVPLVGNYYGNDGTVSSQAKTLGWSADVWDLSGDTPKLKNIQ